MSGENIPLQALIDYHSVCSELPEYAESAIQIIIGHFGK